MFDANTLIQNFKTAFYPELTLSPIECENLSWCMSNPVVTPSGEPSTDVHFEVKRTLNRLSNMDFLRNANYEGFTRTQAEPKMTREQFAFFSNMMRDLTESEYQALRAVTIITAIPFAPKAKEEAKKYIDPLPADSVEFLASTLRHCPEIYPVYHTLDEAGKRLAREAFAFGHLRHMLYVEGNQGMFADMHASCARIADMAERTKAHQFWYLQWFVNVTGFKVETHPSKDAHGSLYLFEGNAEALIQLYLLTKNGIEAPESIPSILADYLSFRFSRLGLSREIDPSLLLTQIAAWSRMYSPSAAVPVLGEVLERYLTASAGVLAGPTSLNTRTPTFAPAIFDNAASLLPENRKLAVHIGLSIYLNAYQEYLSRTAGAASDTFSLPPLSFRLAADKKALQAIVDDLQRFPERQNQIPCCKITLNERFEVGVEPLPAPSLQTFAAAVGNSGGRVSDAAAAPEITPKAK